MRATTIRFTPELWARLEREATREGVSVAQFVRDSALFRIAYNAGSRDTSARERDQRAPVAGRISQETSARAR